jgi:hypothetical protein
MFNFNVLPDANKHVLGWFPKSKCWFLMYWDEQFERFSPVSGHGGDFYGEEPEGWTFLPDAVN